MRQNYSQQAALERIEDVIPDIDAVAVLLGIVFAGETIGLEEALAMTVIIGAVVLIGLPQWRKQKPQ